MGLVTRAIGQSRTLAKYITSPSRAPNTAALASFKYNRYAGVSSPTLYRNLATYSEFARSAVDLRNGQLQNAEYDFVQMDRDGRKPDAGIVRRLRELFDQPNPGDVGWSSLMARVGEDLLVLDAGVIEKERTVNRREIAHLWAADGALIKVDRLWDGSPNMDRYYYCPDPTTEQPLKNDQIIYTMIHPRSHSGVGLSYFETLKMAIDAELTGSLYNARMVTQAAPDGIMDMGENARPEQVKEFKSFWEAELAGQSAMGFWGGAKGAKFIDFKKSNKDQQFIEWQLYEARKIAIVMQLSVQDLQILGDVNRANGEVQQENSEDRGLATILKRAQDYWTSQICWDAGFGGRANNICLRYKAVSDRRSLLKAEEKKITLAGMPLESINSALMDMGRPPLGDPDDPNNPYNKLMANTPLGLVTIDDVPTARELATMKAPAPKEAPNGGAAAKPKPVGSGSRSAK
jgi:Phage portal protein